MRQGECLFRMVLLGRQKAKQKSVNKQKIASYCECRTIMLFQGAALVYQIYI